MVYLTNYDTCMLPKYGNNNELTFYSNVETVSKTQWTRQQSITGIEFKTALEY